MLKIDSLCCSYNNQRVVDNINLTVGDGEFVVLLGPSGCGKSTTLKMIAGLVDPEAGKIELNGKEITHLSPGERKLAMVFQSYALFPHLTVAENILFGLQARKTDKQEQQKRLKSVVELVGLGEHLSKKPGQLSGGQCQRVALARAVVAQANLCLMDEPLSNLDAKLRDEMRTEIRALQQRLGMSVIYVTHDQVEAMSMADKIVLMNGGKVEQIGSPKLLYSQPATPFVAQFVGTPPMNIVAKGDSLVGIRPEHISITETGIAARVIGCDYHGADTIVLADISDPGNAEKLIKIRSAGHVMLDPGQQISVQWEAEFEHNFVA
ncbi:MAG: ABC transporter ATP-binding protein [Gammaproteobacteria bacterium]|nr:ABC transporter ATP-binding protein [Gammaproteobacteria bacterium]MCP4927552.1 ABC transporter ATP-binding protein [Gammaproteobacteria bacterium]MDP6165560.1 ABC transporter ATP-binding protein [Gammaproteobacteria bacterium]